MWTTVFRIYGGQERMLSLFSSFFSCDLKLPIILWWESEFCHRETTRINLLTQKRVDGIIIHMLCLVVWRVCLKVTLVSDRHFLPCVIASPWAPSPRGFGLCVSSVSSSVRPGSLSDLCIWVVILTYVTQSVTQLMSGLISVSSNDFNLIYIRTSLWHSNTHQFS